MPGTSAIPNLPLPGWGRLEEATPAARAPGRGATRRPGRWGGVGELLAAALLVVGWAMLWAFFVAGVVEPAADLAARAADNPSHPAPPLTHARPGAEPGPVDTTGRAP